tara:strand:- start:1983 stop:2906 length:924 start_codon:yes stop_codon:yes gene_type:complete
MFKPKKINVSNFISNLDLNREQTNIILNLAIELKNKRVEVSTQNKVLGLIFNKASTRTRVSFQVAMSRLGGTTIDLNPNVTQLGRGESIKDTARVLSRYCDVLAIRTFKQSDLEEYVEWSSIPIINALTDLEHPCQSLADFMTIKEEFGSLDDVILTYIGDGNNVSNSLMLCGAILGLEVRIVCPEGFEPNAEIVEKVNQLDTKNLVKITHDPISAVKDANVLYTDVWSSMGQENSKESKDKCFKGFTLDEQLVSKADKNPIIMHCLPAYRGKEITNNVFENKKSRIFDQAENRLHAQQSLLSHMLL